MMNINDIKKAIGDLDEPAEPAKFYPTSPRETGLWKEICDLLGVPYEFYESNCTYSNAEQKQIAP